MNDNNVAELLAQIEKLKKRNESLARKNRKLSAFHNIYNKSRRFVVGDSVDYKKVAADSIIETIAKIYDISVDNIKGKSRLPKYVEPRKIAAFVLYELLNLYNRAIGQILGGRDHSTIIYARQSVRDYIDCYDDYADHIKSILDLCRLKITESGNEDDKRVDVSQILIPEIPGLFVYGKKDNEKKQNQSRPRKREGKDYGDDLIDLGQVCKLTCLSVEDVYKLKSKNVVKWDTYDSKLLFNRSSVLLYLQSAKTVDV